MRGLVAVCGLVAATPARADVADDLVEAGQALAKRGEYSRAIDAFKRADATHPRALHACLIALSYTRRELWAQAEVALAACHARMGPGDPLPPWVMQLDDTLATKLGAVDVAPITIAVDAAVRAPMISLSSFPPDETFPPRLVHLTPGMYTVTVTTPDHEPVAVPIVVVAHHPQTIRVALAGRTSSRLPRLVAVSGAVVAAVGFGYDELAVQPLRSRLAAAAARGDGAAWLHDSASFDRRRDVAIGLIAGGAVAIGAAAMLSLTTGHRRLAISASGSGVAIAGSL
jgi:hypothetical protein